MVKELRCSKCKKTKPLNRFSIRREYTRGYDYYCRDCRKNLRASTQGSNSKKTREKKEQKTIPIQNKLLMVRLIDIGKTLKLERAKL